MRMLLGALLALMALTGLAESRFTFDSTPGGLPKTVMPTHYDIHIRPDLAAGTIAGRAGIDIEVREPVQELVLNALDIKVTRAVLDDDTAPSPTTIDANAQTLKIPLTAPLSAGKHRLNIEYTGKIATYGRGLYQLKYKDGGGERVMLATEMEPTDARRLFPCWDEPSFRATFALKAVLPEAWRAVSNMPVTVERTLGDGLKEVAFDTTPSMATYLVALFAGDLEELTSEVDGVKLGIWTARGRRERAGYAMEVTKQVLHYYNDYFGQPYPLPKLDQIALPGGRPGAMENWGAISYEESGLLFDPAVSSLATRQRSYGVIAHEIAHQWFGNLVTMAWWDNLWLNEGFATWMAIKTSYRFNPAWQTWLRVKGEKERAMREDARRTTHPIQQPVATESEAFDALDQITYWKGQAFLRMLEAFLGEDKFRDGLRAYMAAHRFSNTTTADLWHHLETSSGQPVGELGAGWTEQSGLPLVRIRMACRGGRTEIRLTQARFTVNDPDARPQIWKIPVTMMRGSKAGERRALLLGTEPQTVTYKGCKGYVKVNVADTGYYRVAYDGAARAALMKELQTLSPADRLNLLADTWALIEAGRLPATSYLSLAQALKDDTALHVWTSLIETLTRIDTLQTGEAGQRVFRTWAMTLLRAPLARVMWDAKPGEDPTQAQLRGQVIEALGRFDDPVVITEARRRFAAFLAEPRSLPPELRRAVLSTVGRHAGDGDYDRLKALMEKAVGVEEREQYLRALQAARDPALARRTLVLSIAPDFPPPDTWRNFVFVAEDGGHTALAWQYLRDNFPAVSAKIAPVARNRVAARVAQFFSDTARADELEAFVRAHLGADAWPETRKAAEVIRVAAHVKARELPAIDAWVRARH